MYSKIQQEVQTMSRALEIIQDPTLTYRQELVSLAQLGESTDDSLR